MYNGSVYGNYRTRSFADIYEDPDTFLIEYKNNGAIPVNVADGDIKTIWGLLYSYYGNSHIKSSDENRFKYQLFSIIYQYAPTWVKKMDIQDKLRNLTEEDIRLGSATTFASGANPATEITDSQIESAGANAYTRQKTRKSKIEAYAMLYGLLEQDITKEFINRFNTLFRVVALPDAPLWYDDPEITEEDYND